MPTYLQTSGPISLNDINNVFGDGTSLSIYRNATWYKENGTSGTFSSSNLDFAEFYGTGPDPALFPTSAFEDYYNDSSNLSTYVLGTGAKQVLLPARVSLRLIVGFISSAPGARSLTSASFSTISSNWTAWTGLPNPLPLTLLQQNQVYLPAVINRYYFTGFLASPIIYINAPVGISGVVGSVTFNFNGAMSNCAMVTYYLYDSPNLTYNGYYGSFSSSATSQSVSTSASSPSTIIALINSSRGGQTFTWSNITEQAEFDTRSGSDRVGTASIDLASSGAYSFTVSCTSTFQVTAYDAIRVYG